MNQGPGVPFTSTAVLDVLSSWEIHAHQRSGKPRAHMIRSRLLHRTVSKALAKSSLSTSVGTFLFVAALNQFHGVDERLGYGSPLQKACLIQVDEVVELALQPCGEDLGCNLDVAVLEADWPERGHGHRHCGRPLGDEHDVGEADPH